MPIVCQIAEKISVKHNKKANHRTQNPVVLFCMPPPLPDTHTELHEARIQTLFDHVTILKLAYRKKFFNL